MGSAFFDDLSSGKSSAFDQYSEAVVLKVAKPISPALDEFHFSVKAFGDSVVFTKPPHSDDGGKPFSDCNACFLHFERSLVGEQFHHLLEFAYVSSALPYILSFESQEVAELLIEVVAGMDGGVEFEELVQGLLFPACEVAGSFAQGDDDGAFPAYGLLSLFAEFHEVVLDHADDVEAVGHCFGVGEVFCHDCSVA